VQRVFFGESTLLLNIVSLIVGTAASVLAGVLLLRFWMQVVRVRPPISLSQFIYQLTDWLVRPLRRVFPGVAGYDWASLIGAFLIALLATVIELSLAGQLSAQVAFGWSLLRLAEWVFYGLTGLILIGAVFSWVNPQAPLAPFVNALNEPILMPIRRVIPLIGNMDLSPLVALVLLRIGVQVTTYLVSALM
jgi:YggT family protein